MASSLSFFSSPPHPTSDPWQSTTNSFKLFTPQNSAKHSWPSAFAPPSPSPLRTSRNANLMSSPLQGGDRIAKHGDASVEDENYANVVSEALPTTQIPNQDQLKVLSGATPGFLTPSTTTTTSATTNAGTSIFSFDGASTNPILHAQFSFSLDQPTPQDRSKANLFQFSTRARSSSPSALLQSHTKENRDSRKRLFLDRLRTKRDDARVDRAGDQVLRMDFMRERKQWEAEKERADLRWESLDAGSIEEEEMVDADGDDHVGDQVAGLSPVEDKEIEELAERWYSMQEEQDREREIKGLESIAFDEFSDDGYEEAFMVALSQNVAGDRHGDGNVDAEMDLS